MRKFIFVVAFANALFGALAKVHKFSPEFQAIYDAATTPEVQHAEQWGDVVFKRLWLSGLAGKVL